MLSLENLWMLTAAEMRVGYVNHSFTPIDVLNSCLARMNEVEPQINSMTFVCEVDARSAAEQSTKRYRDNNPLSALDGIPITIKDNILTKGMPSTWGTSALKDNISTSDEIVVSKIKDAGLVILGKTNLCEFTLEGYTDNPIFGTSRNPWNIRLTPGGSSGGAAASVAAGVTPLALATDAGGSIRRPASHCGLVGLKPSIGYIARRETLPGISLDFDVVGILARSVKDTITLFDIVSGPSQDDRHSWMLSGASKTLLPLKRSGRILYCDAIDDFPVDSQIVKKSHEALSLFESLGFEIQEGPLPFSLGFTTDRWPVVGQMGLARLFEANPAWRDHASKKYVAMAEVGKALPATLLWEVLEQTETLRRDAIECFQHVDYIITPAAASLPWDATVAYPKLIDGLPVGPRGHAIFASWVNAAGLPAVALPCKRSSEGLPIGIQIVGPYASDLTLLKLAQEYEDLFGAWQDWP